MKHSFASNTSTLKTGIVSEEGDNVILAISGDDFIFSQATIISSVMLEEGTHYIHPLTAKYVNSNGNSWSNQSVKANYKSFVGSYNYVNHVQEPAKSVGFIADVALRRMPIQADGNVHNYYVDILVATHRDHADLIKKIASNKVQFMSMGCISEITQCSKCGQTFTEEYDCCDCLDKSMGKFFIDKNGKKRIVSEMLGDENPGSCNFIEASWLTEVPAFDGAAKRHIVKIPKGSSVQLSMKKDSIKREALQKYVKL